MLENMNGEHDYKDRDGGVAAVDLPELIQLGG